jgi:hypothetical protein
VPAQPSWEVRHGWSTGIRGGGRARVLPAVAPQVADMVRFFLSRGWGIGSGGARGADDYALTAVLAGGPPACARSVVFLPGAVPRGLQSLHAFMAKDGRGHPVPGRSGQ